MTTVNILLTADHRRADQLFDQALHAAGNSDWVLAERAFDTFVTALQRHMRVEEEVLFPAFERATGTSAGPTAVMRQEHRRMLGLLERLGEALRGRDTSALDATARSFAELMNAHSAKEENILYPMCDRALDADRATQERILEVCAAALAGGGDSAPIRPQQS